ncbi:MAG: HepT-like ribonuclease domain-containing protein [Roseiflexus sp.]
MRDPKERLRDILTAIAAIERYSSCEKSEFDQNEMLQVWFLRHLQIIGEAARTLPEEIRVLSSDVLWSEITGMRNVLVHGYFEIDTEIVWNTVQRDVPDLKPKIEALLKRLEEQSNGG